jgi:hypothetical protein
MRNNPWRTALIRMLQPNSDLAAETCEWIIALAVFVLCFGIGVFFGRLTR